MKKINLLEPKLIKGFLDYGSGAPVSYLRIDESINMSALEEDIRVGAVQFTPCLKLAKRGLSRVVVVRASNEEDALMAVNYLAGICNERDRQSEDDYMEESIREELDMEELLSDLECSSDDEEEEIDDWDESASRVPVVEYTEVNRYSSDFSPMFGASYVMAGIPNARNDKPYWLKCTKEAVCIIVYDEAFGFGLCNNFSAELERFKNNRHLFIAVIDEHLNQSDICNGGGEQDIFRFVLENTADMIDINMQENKIKDYRYTQFDNWLLQLNIQLVNRFPKKEIVDKILKLKNRKKSELMKLVLKYVKKESHKEDHEKLTKDDFSILSKFKILGLGDNEEKKYSESLDKELIGMEKVKEQVKNIVQVMKYNKCRAEMGLGNTNFHNVHLLIGAPGTAKTTVAKIMGNIMREENLLPGNRFTCVNGADLKGMFVGHSAPKVKQLFIENDIILIDEAYSLIDVHGSMDSFSQEALAQLMIEIEEHAMDKLVMFAGYGGTGVLERNNKMKKFIDANPGLKSRINSTIFFESYTPRQMVDIVHVQARTQKLFVSSEADNLILEYFEERVKDPNFGNGREARSLLENAMVFSAVRVMQLPENRRTKKNMSEIKVEDIASAVKQMRNDNIMQRGKEKGNCGFFHVA